MNILVTKVEKILEGTRAVISPLQSVPSIPGWKCPQLYACLSRCR